MARIQKLSYQEIQKIAAGEVVERPANVVKELVENSIDAGATKISIYVKDGGHSLIRVVDNGCGMSPEDAVLSFEQHATSKISSVQQLDQLSTHGFRGEALSSIAGVSQVSMITKEADTALGVKLTLEAGVCRATESVASAVGTDISVEQIFFNVPARKKFLKKADTEWRHVVQLFHAYCLSYPHIHFALYLSDKLLYDIPPSVDLASRASLVWDRYSGLYAFDGAVDDVTVSGVFSAAHITRYDRNQIYTFVNNRYVKNYKLSQAIIKGYGNLLLPNQFPYAVVHITLDPSEVDVNIHPRKEEVAFAHPRLVETLITDSIKERLETIVSDKIQSKPFVHQPMMQAAAPIAPFSFARPDLELSSMPMPYATSFLIEEPRLDRADKQLRMQPAVQQFPLDIPQTVFETMDVQDLPHWNLIGQFHKTYLLLEYEQSITFVDQHAAHERVLYEQFKARFGNVPTIPLLFPQLLTLTLEEKNIIEPYLGVLQQAGFVCEPFGEYQLRIEATPLGVKAIEWESFIKETVAWIVEQGSIAQEDLTKKLHEHIHSHMACKAAVKAGDILSEIEMKELLKNLAATENRHTCPHGRPTLWDLPLLDIERKFKRKL